VKVELRPPGRRDAASVAEALNRFNRAAGIEEETPAEIEVWFDAPSANLDDDARVAVVDGEIVGYADVSDASQDGRFLWVDLRVDPAHAAAEPILLEFVERRAGELANAGGLIKAWAPENADSLRDLLEARDYRFHHFSLRMTAGLGDEPPPPEWPGGVSVRTFRRDEDTASVYEAHQETFSDQRDFARDPLDDWQHWSFREPFDPELWFLAVDGKEIAGISLCRSEWGGDTELGWVSILGVRKPWRRRGIGLALLRHSFRELRGRCKTRVGLGVDAENPTGAVRLYERAGMAVERKYLRYEKVAG
jgi:mycothiol synthase